MDILRLHNMLRIGVALMIGFAVFGLSLTAAEAKVKIIRDSCTQTSGDGMGHDCADPDAALVRPLNADGTCGEWICCPPMDNGNYDCANSTSPTRSFKNRFKNFRAPKADTVSPGTTPPSSNTNPVAPTGKKPKKAP
jgi:hypothetical protein